MSKNKKNFIIGIGSAALIFFMGLLYLTVPAYYGLGEMANVDTNDLLLSALLVYSVVNFGEYVILGKNPTSENVYLTIVASFVGLVNVGLSMFINKSMNLSMSMLLFVVLVLCVKLFTIDYYHDRKDAYYYVEGLFTAIFGIVGVVTSFNLFDDTVLQTMMLGFLLILISVIRSSNVAIKSMLKSKRFLRRIKLK